MCIRMYQANCQIRQSTNLSAVTTIKADKQNCMVSKTVSVYTA